MIQPPFLQKGSKIGIISTAGLVSPDDLSYAINFFKENGFDVITGKTIGKIYHTMAGDDEFRAAELQDFLNNPEIQCILFARGGYGTIRIIDCINFDPFVKNPKWLVGFSDMTLLLNHVVRNYGISVIHGPMAKTLCNNASGKYLTDALTGKLEGYKIKSDPLNIKGIKTGVMVGGNLSVLTGTTGSISSFDPEGKILLLEDVGEYLYHTDRMLWNLRRAMNLSKLSGLVAGNFTRMKDNRRPFGKNIRELLCSHFEDFGIPVIFNFPAGHQKQNYSLYFGRNVEIIAEKDYSSLRFL